MAETPDAIHVSFLGTKVGRDHLSNLDLRYQPMALSPSPLGAPMYKPTAEGASGFPSLPSLRSGAAGKGSGSEGKQQGPAAHRGYALRAAGVPLEQMYRLASVAGKRLVLSGKPSTLKLSLPLAHGPQSPSGQNCARLPDIVQKAGVQVCCVACVPARMPAEAHSP